MKCVYQTAFGDKEGNCFPACIASLLELPLEEVPNFCLGDPPNWYDHFQDWLRGYGFSAIELKAWSKARPENWHPNAGQLCILSGTSPRGNFDHSVIGIWTGKDYEMIHDPHPSLAGLAGEIKEVGFLIPLDPAEHRTPKP